MSEEPLIKTQPWEMEAPGAEDFHKAFCELMVAVHKRLDPHCKHPCDCICRHGGMWSSPDYDGTVANGFCNTGKALKAIVEAVEQVIFDKGREDRGPANTFNPEKSPRCFWIGRGGHCVVSNKPVLHGEYTRTMQTVMDDQEAAAVAERIALNAAGDWYYYGGFLVCESCSPDDAHRIVAALTFIEGLPLEFVQRQPFNHLMPCAGGQES